ncbi:MAG: peptidylprolyl isomerase [Phycisphaera sp.]|nr:MAG: peptidylprolyl isomerase [Phycisphaera sp.]
MGTHRALAGTLTGLRVVVAIVVLLALLPATTHAQLSPDRTYYGFDREVPVTVAMPEGQEGETSIVLFNARGDRVARAEVLPGRVDLASFFPILWDQTTPIVLYAQLFVGAEGGEGGEGDQANGTPVGAPLVVQPMVTPRRASTASGQIEWDNAPRIFSGLRIYVDKLLKLNTTEGTMVFRLRPDEAPNTVWHIRELAAGGFYTDIAFHRVLPTHPSGKPFVIQVGDPIATGNGGPGVFIDLEPSTLEHDFGVLSMARTPDPDSNGSQFFVALSREATVHLNGVYTAFGEAVEGAEAIVAIERTPLADARKGKPVEPPRITTAELVDAPPFGTGPEPVTRPVNPGAGER